MTFDIRSSKHDTNLCIARITHFHSGKNLFKLRQCKSSYTVDEIYAIRIQIMLNKGDNMVQL